VSSKSIVGNVVVNAMCGARAGMRLCEFQRCTNANTEPDMANASYRFLRALVRPGWLLLLLTHLAGPSEAKWYEQERSEA
jgi:hypothetical protein